MEVFLKIILFILLIRLLFRIFRPQIMKFVMRRIEKRMQNFAGFEYQQEEPVKQPKKGNLTIDKMPPSTDKSADTSNLGEYVDFEEVDN